MNFKPIKIILTFIEKAIPIIGTILMFKANILLFSRNQEIIDLWKLWAILSSIILLLIFFVNTKDLILSIKKNKARKSAPKYFILVNFALIIFLVIAFYEMVLTEYFAPVGGYEKVFFTLLAGSLLYCLKLTTDAIKLLVIPNRVYLLREFYILFVAFFFIHSLWIVTQDNFNWIALKNRSSIASLFIKELPAGEDFLGHKAFVRGTTKAPYGYLIYEPEEAKSDSKIPLLIFLHGGDETRDSKTEPAKISLAAKHGPSRYIRHGNWNPPTPMIVVSPQTTDGWWRPEMVHEFIAYLIQNYSVDTSRIYLTGLSRGGTGSFDYINYYGDKSYIAAMAPLATDAFVRNSGEFNSEQFKNTPLWLLINDQDKYVADYKKTTEVVKAIQKHCKESKITIFPKHGHDTWTYAYTLQGQGLERSEYAPFDMNIYEWFLQYQKIQ